MKTTSITFTREEIDILVSALVRESVRLTKLSETYGNEDAIRENRVDYYEKLARIASGAQVKVHKAARRINCYDSE